MAQIIEQQVSAEDYMAQYAHDGCEWVDGRLLPMTPITLRHSLISRYLETLLAAYFDLNPVGVVLAAPFVMRLDSIPSRREPDLQVVLHNTPGDLTETAMIGPADLCIEIVSEKSSTRDYGEKFTEYERGGVRTYWIIDPLRTDARFYELADNGRYQPGRINDDHIYHPSLLPGFALHVPTLWADPLPTVARIVESVRGMVK